MKILYFCDNFPPESNAPASRVYERACYWVDWGHDVSVMTCAPNYPEGKVFPGYKNKWTSKECIDGISVIRVKSFMAKNSGFFLRILDYMSYMASSAFFGLFQKKPDVIMANSPHLFCALGALFVAKIKRCPFVLELADIWPASIWAVGAMKHKLAFSALEKLELFIYRKSDAIIPLSPAFKENLIRRGIDQQKITPIVNGVDLRRYSPQSKDLDLIQKYNLEGKIVFGYIGTHGMAHALENILYCAELLKARKDVHFLFVGGGAAREQLIATAKKLNLHNATFIASQPKAVIKKYWSLCDVALIHLKNSSVFTEVIPSKIFEAMGMKLPILLAAPSGTATAIVEKTKSGITVPAEMPERLASAVRSLLDDKHRAELAENSYSARHEFSRENQAERMLQVLGEYLPKQPCLNPEES